MKKIHIPLNSVTLRLYIFYQHLHHLIVPLLKEKNDTKVFCVGYAKTGTSSISKSLSILGYRSVHWLHAGIEPKEGWISYMKKCKYDAFADMPIIKKDFFKTLDKEFPNSKFILTMRDTQPLLSSWENYFKGQPLGINSEEDRKKVKQFYEKHNKQVIDYFKDKPSQLLVMNIFKEDGWNKLCNFLNKSVPNTPFPYKNIGFYKK